MTSQFPLNRIPDFIRNAVLLLAVDTPPDARHVALLEFAALAEEQYPGVLEDTLRIVRKDAPNLASLAKDLRAHMQSVLLFSTLVTPYSSSMSADEKARLANMSISLGAGCLRFLMDACGFDKNNPDDVSAFIALTTQGKFASMEDVEAFVAAREKEQV